MGAAWSHRYRWTVDGKAIDLHRWDAFMNNTYCLYKQKRQREDGVFSVESLVETSVAGSTSAYTSMGIL